MEEYYRNILLKLLRSDSGLLQESFTIPLSQSIPFGDEFNHALSDIDVQATFRKPSSTNVLSNLFSTFEGKSADGYKGRIGTYYGIQELTYSDKNTSDKATITATNTLTHHTFSWGDDVAAGDMIIVSGMNPDVGTNAGVRRVVSGSGTDVVTYAGLGTIANDVDCAILKLAPIQLFTVPSPNGVGTEQLFLTVDPSSDVLTNSSFSSDLSSINPYRIYPLIPPRSSDPKERADGIFYKISDLEGTGASDLSADEWGFRLILYPSNSAGSAPDLTKPISTLNPIIDRTKPLDEQEMLIDYANGSVYFTTPPRVGDNINPNGHTGFLKLWAVFAAFSFETAVGDTIVRNSSRAILDLQSGADDVYDMPSYFKYNKSKRVWNMYSGTGALKSSSADQPLQGFEVGDDTSEEPGGFILDPVNTRWQVNSSPTSTANYQGLFLYSGISGSQNPGIGVEVSSIEYGLRFDNSTLIWGLSGAGLYLDQGSSDDDILLFRSSDVDHGMTTWAPTDVYGLFAKVGADTGGVTLLGLGESTDGVKIVGMSTTADTTSTSSSVAPIHFDATKKNGTTVQALAATDNLMVMRSGASTKWILKGNGDQYVTGSYGNFDSESDALACQDLAYELAGMSKKVIEYNREKLEAIGVMKNGFIHLNNMIGLQLGAIGEIFKIVDYLCKQLGLDYNELRKLIRS